MQKRNFFKNFSEFQLKSESKGNWKKKTWFIYKNELNNPPQTSRQAVSVALQTVATSSQIINLWMWWLIMKEQLQVIVNQKLVLLELLKSVEDLQK